jgi:hypothetical protein
MPSSSWRPARWYAGIAIVILAVMPMSCESVPVGPSLANVKFSGPNGATIETRPGWLASQLPTVFSLGSATQRDPSVCCCQVRGTVTNSNTVPVHVIMQFAAIDANGKEIARILNFAQDLQPNSSFTIPDDAACRLSTGSPCPGTAGFLLSCSSIDHVNYQLNVSSLAPPLI